MQIRLTKPLATVLTALVLVSCFMALYNVGQTSAGYNEDYELYLKSTEGGTTSPAPGSYTCDNIEVEAIPYPGYSFAYWLVNGVQDLSGPVISGTLQDNTEIEAVFTRNQYTLTVITNGQGAVNVGNATYQYGDQINLQATAADGWTFAGWSGDATGTTDTTITMNGNKTVIATFTQNTYPLTITIVGQGTVNEISRMVPAGTTISLVATAANGWSFARWNGDATGILPHTEITMNSAKFVIANFTKDRTLMVKTVGQGTVTPSNQTYTYGEVVNLTATAAPGWTFIGWGDDAEGATSTTLTILMDTDKTFTANFMQNTYTLNTLTSGQGTVSTGNTTVLSGTALNLTATPADGWKFSGWSGAVTSINPTISILLDSDKTVTATFTKANTTPVQIVDGNITQAQCTEMTITKVPFGSWGNGLIFNFTVTGPSGTFGTCKIAIPKAMLTEQLLEDVTDIIFYVDNIPNNFDDFDEDDTNYYLTFRIHFSTHDICIEFREAEPTPTPSPTETPAPTTTPTTTPTPRTTPRPTATPTVTPTATPTSTPTPTTQPTSTPKPITTNDLTLPIAGAVALLAVVLVGLVAKSRKRRW